MFGKKKTEDPGEINIKIHVDTTELDAAMVKMETFKKMMDDISKSMDAIDKRVEAIPHDTLEDSGVG